MIVVWVVFRDMAGKVKCFNGNPHFWHGSGVVFGSQAFSWQWRGEMFFTTPLAGLFFWKGSFSTLRGKFAIVAKSDSGETTQGIEDKWGVWIVRVVVQMSRKKKRKGALRFDFLLCLRRFNGKWDKGNCLINSIHGL
jgi:hypothetical protein